MSQINLDTSPYFDDFDADKDYYKVLFKPGFPVQARELTTLQSILQNQISTFGEHFFKEGSMVIPGGITYNPQYTAVILEAQQGGIDVSLYLDQLVGKSIRGEVTGVRAKVIGYALPPQDAITNPTIFVTYTDSGNDDTTVFFTTNESLLLDQAIVYGNTTITANSIFATTVSTDATAVGSAAEIAEGVYFLRGTFVQVSKSSIVLEPYVNTPSYRVGLQITEQIVTAGQDNTLYDNAKGFNNFSAPGADRLKITLKLIKKPLNDYNDSNFVELLRVDFGEVKKLEENSNYNIIKEYIAGRTFDESGDYVINGFQLTADDSLNDNMGNGGIYNAEQTTEGGSKPSEDLAILKVSSGKAYVRGFDIKNPGTVNIDAPKARTTETQTSTGVPFEMGSKYFVNNVTSTPVVGLDIADNIIQLYSGRLDDSKEPTGDLIGEARVYSYSLEDAPYTSPATPWNLYLYDFQIFTKINLNRDVTSLLLAGYRVRGLSSGATGFVRTVSSDSATLTEVSGEFIIGERISINGSSIESISIASLTINKQNQVKSVKQNTSSLDPNIAVDFSADTRLYARVARNFAPSDTFSIDTSGFVTCAGRSFDSFKVGDIVVWQDSTNATLVYNEVLFLLPNDLGMNVGPVSNVAGVAAGTLPTSDLTGVNLRATESRVLNTENSALYVEMEKENIAKVNLDSSQLYFTTQITQQATVGSTLTLNRTLTGVNDALFTSFDQERYSIVYNDGTTETIGSEQVSLSADSTVITFTGLSKINEIGITVNVTAIKPSIKSKTKVLLKSQLLLVDKISPNLPADFGLTSNEFYGLRVDDEEISLNVADVESISAVYESLDGGDPVLDVLGFVNGLSLDANTVKGELILGSVSGTVAKMVDTTSPSNVRIVYFGQSRFEVGEEVIFSESNIKTNLQVVQPGNYNDITSKYTLDKGQREQFYDFSRLIRNGNAAAPNKKLLIVFDQFGVPADDNGDFYTANSYVEEIFATGVPMLRGGRLRASDTLDFRPRVAPFTATDASPFDYTSRDFATSGSTVVLVTAPDESMVLGYDYFVGRKDRVVLNTLGELKLVMGAPAFLPQLPESAEAALEIARVTYPPYVYDVDDITIITLDNRRYTMRDIGELEDRIETLEEVTSLSLLERETQSLQVLDADGNDRFKSGFFADDFRNTDFIDFDNPEARVVVGPTGTLEVGTQFASIPMQLQPESGIDINTLSLDQDFPLIDSNVRKTGDLVTLNYNQIEWLNQPLASRVENVNPFNVILYDGGMTLNPASDDFIVTRSIGNRQVNVFGESDEDFSRTFVEGIEVAQFMRERNVAFNAREIKPLTRFYPFFEGSGGIDFVPKLIEITMQNGTFQVGEAVIISVNNQTIFSARVAVQNHKTGPFNSPTTRFTTNPYNRDELISDGYSSSSTVLNVDIQSLSNLSDERYFGLIGPGLRLVGDQSGAIAVITDQRLVSDVSGDLFGSIYFRDPYTDPAPNFRLRTGIRTFRLSSSPTNELPQLGETIISFAEASFTSGGTIQNRRTESVNIRELPPPPPPIIIDRTVTNNFTTVIDRTVTVRPQTNITQITNITQRIRRRRRDPLAQTFFVDGTGAFLTGLDIYMKTKSEVDNLTIQIRRTELEIPLSSPIQDFAEVILTPNEVIVSDDATLPTPITFPSPIYLEPNVTYAVVLLAPTTDDYTAWIARMGENNITTPEGAASGAAVISQQYLGGSLFKSQNGSLWTPSQFEDLKFTLYKAQFVDTGTVFLNNPSIFETTDLDRNPIQTLPRKLTVFVEPTTYAFETGEKLASTASGVNNIARVVGEVEFVGAGVTLSSVTEGGIGYLDGSYSSVELTPINTNGINVLADVTITGGQVGIVSITSSGSGYRVGDTLGITTSLVGGSGGDAVVTVDSVGDTDTVFLTNVIGEKINITDSLNSYDEVGNVLTAIGTTISAESEVTDPMNTGSVFVLDLAAHGMMADNNIVRINGCLPDTLGTDLVEGIDISSNQITVVSPELFSTFEGISSSIGYLLVGGEIMEYTDNGDGTLGITSRGVDSTLINIHDQGSRVFKYELSGVSLRRINTEHQLPTDQILGNTRDFNTLPLEIDRGVRSIDVGITPYTPQLSFNQEQQSGGNSVRSSQNFQYNAIFPAFGVLTPGATTQIDTLVRTVTGTSAGGNEASFIDQGSEPIVLNAFNDFDSPRLVASIYNENAYLQDLPNNKSLTMALTFRSSDPNLSPALDINQATVFSARSALNNPVSNYADDPRTNQLLGDPHTSIYISQKVDLDNPATSLKVILTAYRDETADFRVCYRLFGADTQGSTEPSWVLFPGYDNLLDTTGNGIGDKIIDVSKFSGLPNKKVRASRLIGPSGFEDLEYLYEIDSLPEFSAFQLKIVFSGTNEARPPSLNDIRAIALA
ncbi:virulence-associated structural protein [Synechococcus phage S-CAM7]|uniref:Virulence-associated structural protein n=1 Tax=Synechococcus phage S-CAM7 TaxID=1883368 RepID=A0A1D8KUP9_9CAUD|nr:virulence-associated structural protein [Synechococcus phage S-CAM7]AOV62054.1 virulence-associated structural protein [Synechococcus phage S-CAM7]AOV62317.1 virulence-associated structural protein [Synechococcus phage S-CAM7]